LVKGSVSFKECEEAKTSPHGSKLLNEKIKDIEQEAVTLPMAQKCVTRNLWAFHVSLHLEKSDISIGLQSLCQYLQERQWQF
jgi:hypothetical protein